MGWRGYFEKGNQRLRNICMKSWCVSWYALENYGLGFESCLGEGNDGWMQAMLILRRYLMKENGKDHEQTNVSLRYPKEKTDKEENEQLYRTLIYVHGKIIRKEREVRDKIYNDYYNETVIA